jgi:multidrug resistance efflux pump
MHQQKTNLHEAPSSHGTHSRGSFLDPHLWKTLYSAKTDKQFFETWLHLQCLILSDICHGAVFWQQNNGKTWQVVALWPATFHSAECFLPIVERVRQEKRGVAIQDTPGGETAVHEQGTVYIAYPVYNATAVQGVAALEIAARPSEQLQAAMRQLQWGMAWLEHRLQRNRNGLIGNEDDSVEKRLFLVFDITAAVLQEADFKSSAALAVTETANRLQCDRVSVGFVRNSRVRLAAISHRADFGKNMNLVRAIEDVMDESVDQCSTVQYPQPDHEQPAVAQAHAKLSHITELAALTIPFLNKEGLGYGALTFERAGDNHFTGEAITLCEALAAFFGPILEEKRLNARSVYAKVGASFRDQLKKVFGRGHLNVKISLCCLAMVVLFLSLVTANYRVPATATLEGSIQRVIIAPFDGYLHESLYRAGDVVKKDQILARLDTRDLMLERLKWTSKKKQHLLEFNRAMSKNETATYAIIKEQINQAQLHLSLLEDQLARSRIRAPFTGVLISGDLSQAIGAPVNKGQLLFEIAPLNSYRIMLDVGEQDIDLVRVGKKGTVVLNALPELSFPFQVSKITPVSAVKAGNTVFVVEGSLLADVSRLRPGMVGYGKIDIEARKLIWIWTHPFMRWVRLKLWTIIP